MRAVCAWCGATRAEGEPGDRAVSHGICPACSRIWSAGLTRCVVLPSQRAFLLPEIQRAFRDIRDVRVVVDRRQGERRRQATRVHVDRRERSRDRRQLPGLIVGAIPCVGGFWLPTPSGQLPALQVGRDARLAPDGREETPPPWPPLISPDGAR